MRGSVGIYPLQLDAATGALSPAGPACPADEATYLDLDTDRGLVFALGKLRKTTADTLDKPAEEGWSDPGFVASYRLIRGSDADSSAIRLEAIDRLSLNSGGACHIVVDAARRLVALANYGDGTADIAAYREDGSFLPRVAKIIHSGKGPNPDRQEKAHAHQAVLTHARDELLIVDLGIDRIMRYAWPIDPSAASRIRPVGELIAPAGTGPRHLVLSDDDLRLYALMEMGNEVVYYGRERAAEPFVLRQRISSLPPGVGFDDSMTGAAIRLASGGSALLTSNRGHDSISLFTVNPDDGRLSFADNIRCGWRNPRDFDVLPQPDGSSWIVVGSEWDDKLISFRLEAEEPRLTGPYGTVTVPSPVHVLPLAVI